MAVWVEATRFAPGVPREHRVSFCNGLGMGLVAAGTIATGIGYYVQSALPVLFGAAAMFVTPLSFLISTARNARLLLEKAALAFGLVIGARAGLSPRRIRPALDRHRRRHASPICCTVFARARRRRA